MKIDANGTEIRVMGDVVNEDAYISLTDIAKYKTNAAELVADFHGAVDDYLELCAQSGTEPEKAYKGSFNVRISPELHKQAVIAAMSHNMSLNSFVETSIQQALHAGA